MAYTIQKTDGTTLVTVEDTQTNTQYGITLIGRNYSGYGVFLNDNFVRLMENSANTSAPAIPLDGQLWFKSDTNVLYLYNGNGFKALGSVTVSSGTPDVGPTQTGDLWWDTTNQQLKAYSSKTLNQTVTQTVLNTDELRLDATGSLQVGDIVTSSDGTITLSTGSKVEQIISSSNIRITNPVAAITNGVTLTFQRGTGWSVVGPQWTAGTGVTALIAKTIIDTIGVAHSVGLGYVKDQVTFIVSRDFEFVPRPADYINGFPVIRPGITLHSGSSFQVVKTASVNNGVGDAAGTVIGLSSVDGIQSGDQIITANVHGLAGITVQNIFTSNTSILASANTFFANNTPSIYSGENVIFQRGNQPVYLINGTASGAQTLGGISADVYARKDIDQVFLGDITLTQGNLYIGDLRVWDNNGDLNVNNLAPAGDYSLYVRTVGGATPTDVRAFYVDGHSGLAQVAGDPTAALGVATKGYTDASLVTAGTWILGNIISVYGTPNTASLVSFSAVSNRANLLQAGIDTINNTALPLKANLNSPTFTGSPQSVTPPPGTANAMIATAAMVAAAMTTVGDAWKANAGTQQTQIDLKAPTFSPAFTGVPISLAVYAPSDSTANLATTQWTQGLIQTLTSTVNTGLSNKVDSLNGVMTGNPLAPTMPAFSNNTAIATTAHVFATTAFKANLAGKGGATFTGNISVPALAAQDISANVPNTQWVQTWVNNYGNPVNWSGSKKFISSAAPTSGDGANGDIWFQYTP